MTKRTYDIRLRNAIAIAADPDLFPDLTPPPARRRCNGFEKAEGSCGASKPSKSCDALSEENALQKKCTAELKAKWLDTIDTIDTAKAHLSLKDCLERIGLTAATAKAQKAGPKNSDMPHQEKSNKF